MTYNEWLKNLRKRWVNDATEQISRCRETMEDLTEQLSLPDGDTAFLEGEISSCEDVIRAIYEDDVAKVHYLQRRCVEADRMPNDS